MSALVLGILLIVWGVASLAGAQIPLWVLAIAAIVAGILLVAGK